MRGSRAHVARALALRLGVDQQVVAVGVHPGEQGLGLAVGHQRDHGGQVGALGQADGVVVEGHGARLSVRVAFGSVLSAPAGVASRHAPRPGRRPGDPVIRTGAGQVVGVTR